MDDPDLNNPAIADVTTLVGMRFGTRDLKFFPRRMARTSLMGGHHSRTRGRGMDFEEVRQYQPGDDIRSIDWRVTARTLTPHTKLFREERERPILVITDLRPNMFFGSKMLKSITAYRDLDESIVQDYGGGAPGFRVNVTVEQEQFSQELQLVGEHSPEWRYVAGLYYFEEEGLEEEFDTVPLPPNFTPAPVEDRVIDSEAKAYALYGQATWSPAALEHRLDVTLGGRYTVDDRSATKNSTIYFTNGKQSGSEEWSNFNPSLTVDYNWSDDLSTYAKVVSAYKAGGYNVRSTEAGFQPPFDEEQLLSYEAGLKSTWLDNRLSFNAAVFRAEYEDMQLQQITNNATIFLTDVYNVGEAEIDGLEMDLMAVLLPGLTLQLSYGYTDADFVEYIDQRNGSPTQGDNIAGRAVMPYAPEHSYTVGLDYQAQTPLGALKASVDYSWRDERYGTAFNDDLDGFFLDDYGLVNARVSLSEIPVGDSQLEVAVWGRNLTDEEYKVHSISLGTYHAAYFGEPETVGLDVTLRF